jgi:hypothetical protein
LRYTPQDCILLPGAGPSCGCLSTGPLCHVFGRDRILRKEVAPEKRRHNGYHANRAPAHGVDAHSLYLPGMRPQTAVARTNDGLGELFWLAQLHASPKGADRNR